MVKILGINGKVIITILYVYYWETNAGFQDEKNIPDVKEKAEILDVWEPNPEFDLRRSQSTKKITPDEKSGKPTFRNKAHHVNKFTKGFRAETRHSERKHIAKNGSPRLEPLEINRKYASENDDYDDYDKTMEKNNIKKSHSVDKYHNNMGKKHYTDTRIVEHRDKYKKTKYPKTQTSLIKNSKMGREKGKYEDKDDNRHYSHDKKHQSSNKKSDEKNHKNYKTHTEDEDQNNNKHTYEYQNTKRQTSDRHVTSDRYHSKDKQNSGKHLSTNKFQNHITVQPNILENENKNKFSKDKNHLREKVHSKDGDKGANANAPESTTTWPIREHRAKLKTQDKLALRSTRMTPMYLMQQPEETEKEQKPTTEAENEPYYLSPYSLASQLKRIMAGFPGANATIEVLDRTVEYNDLIIIKMTESKNDDAKYFRAAETKYMDEVPEKKIIFIVHGLSVMGMYQLDALASEDSFKQLVSYYIDYLDSFDIYLMPMANPDGYSASTSNNLWNKNKSPQDACPGVNLDRNFDVAWNGTKKVSSCSQMYAGKSPFSEVETRAVRDVFHYHGHKILAYIHVHAGTYENAVFKGDAILYPRGFTESQSDDDKYIDLKGEIDEAMKNATFKVLSVTVDTLCSWYGKVSGSSVDYAATVYGIPYALEFVMQLYGQEGETSFMSLALDEVWSRLIDTTFNNMYNSLRTNEVQRK